MASHTAHAALHTAEHLVEASMIVFPLWLSLKPVWFEKP